jgi:Fic family protein
MRRLKYIHERPEWPYCIWDQKKLSGLLTKSEKSPNRFYSMSSQIQLERNEYYHQLEAAQKGSLNITGWIEWFLGCFKNAIAKSASRWFRR